MAIPACATVTLCQQKACRLILSSRLIETVSHQWHLSSERSAWEVHTRALCRVARASPCPSHARACTSPSKNGPALARSDSECLRRKLANKTPAGFGPISKLGFYFRNPRKYIRVFQRFPGHFRALKNSAFIRIAKSNPFVASSFRGPRFPQNRAELHVRPNRTEENSATKGLLFAIRGAEFKVNRNPNVDELNL